MTLPETQPNRSGPTFSGQWTELSPNALYMTQHIGTLTVADGRKWEISGSLNGMAVFIETDLSYAADVKSRHGGATDHRRFMIDTSPLVKQLAATLLSTPDETPSPEPREERP